MWPFCDYIVTYLTSGSVWSMCDQDNKDHPVECWLPHSPYGEFNGTSRRLGRPDGRPHSPHGEFRKQFNLILFYLVRWAFRTEIFELYWLFKCLKQEEETQFPFFYNGYYLLQNCIQTQNTFKRASSFAWRAQQKPQSIPSAGARRRIYL